MPYLARIGIAALIATGWFATLSVAQEASSVGSVEGTVVNSATGAGIGGASVVLSGNQSSRYQTTSDAAGHFRVAGMAPGSYRANVEKDGFARQFDLNQLLSAASEFRVVSGADPVKVEFKLTPLNGIRGRVLRPDGKPAPGLEVSLNPNIFGSVVTDDQGRFAMDEIRPGTYTLVARPPGSAKPDEARDGTKTAMVSTYYPSVVDQTLAERIVCRGEGDLSGYEIRMQTAPVHRVRGIVLGEDGKPSPGAELTLLPVYEGSPEPLGMLVRRGGPSFFALGIRPEPATEAEAMVIAESDGRFEFPAVRPGNWRITAESDAIRGNAQSQHLVTLHGRASVFVGRGDLDNLEIRVAKPFTLTGTIGWKGADSGDEPGSNPRPLFSPLVLITPDNNEFGRGGIVASAEISFDSVLPGRYKAIAKPGLSTQIFLGENDVTEQAFTVSAGGPRMRVVLKTWAGSVRGTVGKGDGATVVLVPQRVDGVSFGQTIIVGAGGSFEMNEVSPGDYNIAAFDHMDGLSPSRAMINLVTSRGTSVRVAEGASADVTLSLIAVPR